VLTSQAGWMLVVDDDATDRMALFRLLERDGHHATVADNGHAALDLLREEPYDLVLLDLLMPDPDGYAVLETMKSDGQLRNIPVIVVTALDERDGVVRCLELGADDYVPKPFDPALLRARIGASLEKKRLREREGEVLELVGHVAEAASAVGSATFEPEQLEPLTRRPDSLGELARAIRELGSRVADLRAQLEAP